MSTPDYLDAAITRAETLRDLDGFGVTAHMVSMWVTRGWLGPDGERRFVRVLGQRWVGQRRERLFRRGDLLAAEADTRMSANSRRNLATEAA